MPICYDCGAYFLRRDLGCPSCPRPVSNDSIIISANSNPSLLKIKAEVKTIYCFYCRMPLEEQEEIDQECHRNCLRAIRMFEENPTFSYHDELPAFNIALDFTNQSVKISTLDSKELVVSYELPSDVLSVEFEEESSTYKITYHDLSTQPLKIHSFGLVDSKQTGGQYILSIDYDEEKTGYYFGLYEVGMFVIHPARRVSVTRRWSMEFVRKGWVVGKNRVVISLRERSRVPDQQWDYSTLLAMWSENGRLSIHRSIDCNEPLETLTRVSEDRVVGGLRDGSIKCWTDGFEDCLWKRKVFDSPVLTSILWEDSIYVGSYSGELAKLDANGTVFWKIQLGEEPFYNILPLDDRFYIIDCYKRFYVIEPRAGAVVRRETIEAECRSVSSGLTLDKELLVFSGDAYLFGLERDSLLQKSRWFPDPLIRIVTTHPEGIVTGDDDGKLNLWRQSWAELGPHRTQLK